MEEQTKPRKFIIGGILRNTKGESKSMSDNKDKDIVFNEEKKGDTEKYNSAVGVRTPPPTPKEESTKEQIEQALREELKQKMTQETTQTVIDFGSVLSDPEQKAIAYGIIGSGHGGSRLAEQFHQFGYKVGVINTAKQDLAYINLPQQQKLHLDFALGGVGKDLDLGEQAYQESEEQIKEFLDLQFGKEAEFVDQFILCVGGGGGCISGDSYVHTSRGLEKIRDLYNSYKDSDVHIEEPTEFGSLINVRDENIKTNSLNNNGKFEEDDVLELSKYQVSKDRSYSVKLKNGTVLNTSDTHKFFVLDNGKIQEKQTKDLLPRDLVFHSNIEWKQKEEGLHPDLAWLVGLSLGDGSFIDSTSKSFRIYTDDSNTLERAKNIIKEHFNVDVTYKKSNRAEMYELSTGVVSLCDQMLSLCGLVKYGSKTHTLDIPNTIFQGSKESAHAFVAGFLDADGYISDNKKIQFSCVSKNFIEKFTMLLQLLGYKATFSSNKTKSVANRDVSNWKEMYVARVTGGSVVLAEQIIPFMTNQKRLGRLKDLESITPRISIPIDRTWFLGALEALQIKIDRKDHSTPVLRAGDVEVCIHDLKADRADRITLDKLLQIKKVVESLGDPSKKEFDELMTYCTLGQNVVEITEVKQTGIELDYYDLCVRKNNNYLAGENGLALIHNSGSGSLVPLIQLLSEYNLPITVLYTLPQSNEGTVTKWNAIVTLDKLSKLAINNLINGLIVIDNSRIEEMYANVSLGGFFKIANYDIANIFNAFNTMSSLPTEYVAIDPMDFARIMSSGNCIVYGKLEIPLYEEDGQIELAEDDIATALLHNIQNNLLAEGFDISEAMRAGVYVTGKKRYLDQIPASAFNYAFASLNELLEKADTFKGVYPDERLEDKLVIYTIIAGLGLPRERIDQLKEQAEDDLHEMEAKESSQKQKMAVFDQVSSKEKDSYRQQKKKQSSFGKIATRKRTRN